MGSSIWYSEVIDCYREPRLHEMRQLSGAEVRSVWVIPESVVLSKTHLLPTLGKLRVKGPPTYRQNRTDGRPLPELLSKALRLAYHPLL